MKQEKLFSEFSKPTYEDWKKEAEALLKGAPFEKKMLTKTPEGIVLQPIYNAQDVKSAPALPGFGDYVRGIESAGYRAKPWFISQDLYSATPSEFNAKVLDALNKGQTAIELCMDARTRAGLDADASDDTKVGCKGLSAGLAKDFADALKDVEVECVDINLHAGIMGFAVAPLLYAAFPGKQFTGGVYFDPLTELAANGSLPKSLEKIYDAMFALASYNAAKMPKMGAIGIDTLAYSSAGASAVEELAAAFASAVEYIREMLKRGMKIDEVAPLFRFRLSLGSSFFTEIAKLRAARSLWSKIIEEFGGNAQSRKMRIAVRTAVFNKTKYDPYVNMLRTTTEAFSGIIGGCETMTLAPFDEVVRKPDDFSMRIARNQQVLLQEECNLCDVVDPAGGSYFVENLTSAIAEKTWEMFAAIESKGGMAKALEEGFLQDAISKTAQARKKLYDTRRSVVVGTNSYANMSEQPLEKSCCKCKEVAAIRAKEVSANRKIVEVSLKDKSGSALIEGMIYAAAKGMSLQTILEAFSCNCGMGLQVKPLEMHRAVEHFEALRTASAQYKATNGHGPKVFLATMGPLVQHKARADFIRGFFEVGGFEVVYPKGFDTAEAAADEFASSGAKLAVICSTDATYPELVPAVTKAIKSKCADAKVLLAGTPAPEFEALYTEAGLDGEVSIRSNNYESLKSFLSVLGVI